jgi:microcystin-dependent protein
MTEPVADLAEEISPPDAPPTTYMRVGVITATETAGSRRVQLDIAADAWVNRLQDTQLAIGDRVSVLQQGPVLLVIGRLEGTDAFTPVGAIIPYAGATAPTNWVLCNGAAISRSTYAGLFGICGTTYGAGNGTSTFNVPDLRNRLPMGTGTTFALGTTGTGSVTLSTNNMPSHNHTLSGTADSAGSHGHSLSGSVGSAGTHSHSVGNQGGRSDLLATGGTSAATSGSGSTGSDGDHSHSMSGSADAGGSHSHSLSGSTGSNGSGTAFTTTGPYQALQYIIRAI